MKQEVTFSRVLQAVGSDVEKTEVQKLEMVCKFLEAYPEFLSWRGKAKPDLSDESGIKKIAGKFLAARTKKDTPKEPATVPDEVVSIVMNVVYGYPLGDLERIKTEHKHSMSAENIVGVLLERYIASVIEGDGWVWCAGDFVKAIDFLFYDEKTKVWHALQVKNRDNTENSSSAAIRSGRSLDIKKWFRTFAKTGKDNWTAFPIQQDALGSLSEDDFRAFVSQYLA